MNITILTIWIYWIIFIKFRFSSCLIETIFLSIIIVLLRGGLIIWIIYLINFKIFPIFTLIIDFWIILMIRRLLWILEIWINLWILEIWIDLWIWLRIVILIVLIWILTWVLRRYVSSWILRKVLIF